MDFVIECNPCPWPKKEIGTITYTDSVDTRYRRTLKKVPTLIPKDADGLFESYKENIRTTVKIQMTSCGWEMIPGKNTPIILACHFFLPRPLKGDGAKMPFPIVRGGKYKSPDLDNLEYAIGNILQKLCYWDDIQIVGRPFTPTKNYGDYTLKRWPVFYRSKPHVRHYYDITPALKTYISDYLEQCKQPFVGVFIRVETI